MEEDEEKIKAVVPKGKYDQYPKSPSATVISDPQHPGGGDEELQQQQVLPYRRPCCTSFAAISCLFGAFLVMASLAVLLALSLASFHDPTITLASARVILNPYPAPAANATTNTTTLGLDLLVCNPNGAAPFDHGPGTTLLWYRGQPLGSVEASGGRVPANGCEHVPCELALDGLFLSEGRRAGGLLERIIDDAAQHGGEVPFDAQTRLQGTVHVLGVFRRQAVAAGTCHVVVKLSLAKMSVLRYTCRPATDL